MTSGNRRSEPTCTGNGDARQRLRGIADCLLVHDREIALRNDDSLAIIQHNVPQVWRRARGFAPKPIRIPFTLSRCVLAMGAEIRNTVALAYGNTVVMSPHVGDLETPEAVEGLESVVDALPRFLERTPECIAVDLHPDMHSTTLGRRLAARRGIPVVEVQHHHAHAAACLAEHGLDRGLALLFDGTGLGPDGHVWGAELLQVDPSGYRRLATFAPVPLPGGDAAVREPGRQLVGRWHAAGVDITAAWMNRLQVNADQLAVWQHQCRQGLNAPLTHAAGRLFDSFACLLGIAPHAITYEGQPAIRLEACARRHSGRTVPALPFDTHERNGLLEIDWAPAFARIGDPSVPAARQADRAMAVHQAVADAAFTMLEYGLQSSPFHTVALSGGVFMNSILNDLLIPRIEQAGVRPLIHRTTPPNDGCISFGQAVVAGIQR